MHTARRRPYDWFAKRTLLIYSYVCRYALHTEGQIAVAHTTKTHFSTSSSRYAIIFRSSLLFFSLHSCISGHFGLFELYSTFFFFLSFFQYGHSRSMAPTNHAYSSTQPSTRSVENTMHTDTHTQRAPLTFTSCQTRHKESVQQCKSQAQSTVVYSLLHVAMISRVSHI